MDNSTELFSLEVDETAKSTFLEMARWTKFLSILGLIFLGLMVLIGLALGMMADSLPGNNPIAAFGATGIIVYFLFLAGICIYPIITLLKYSTGIKAAINMNDKGRFNRSINHLKNTFKYYGILMIIMLCIYGVALVAVAVAGLSKR